MTEAQQLASKKQQLLYKSIRIRNETWNYIVDATVPQFGESADVIVRRALGLRPLPRSGPRHTSKGRK
jgi:hypothetical protein